MGIWLDLSWLKSLDVGLETMGNCWRMLIRRVTWSHFSFRQIYVTTTVHMGRGGAWEEGKTADYFSMH